MRVLDEVERGGCDIYRICITHVLDLDGSCIEQICDRGLHCGIASNRHNLGRCKFVERHDINIVRLAEQILDITSGEPLILRVNRLFAQLASKREQTSKNFAALCRGCKMSREYLHSGSVWGTGGSIGYRRADEWRKDTGCRWESWESHL